METALGLVIPIKKCGTVIDTCKTCVTFRQIGKYSNMMVCWIKRYHIQIIISGLPDVKSTNPKIPVEKKHEQCHHCFLYKGMKGNVR